MSTPSGFVANTPAPAEYAAVVTPGASDLPAVTRGIYIATTGNLTVVMVSETNDANTVTFKNLPAGALLPLRVRKITAAPADTVALF